MSSVTSQPVDALETYNLSPWLNLFIRLFLFPLF